LRALLALDALRTLQALNALGPFGTGRTGIALRAAVAGGTWWADPGGTRWTDGTWWACGTGRACRTGETGRTAFCEQLGSDLVRVDSPARFDRLQSTIVIADAHFDLVERLRIRRLLATEKNEEEPGPHLHNPTTFFCAI
jgi:hypothetical protein